MIYSRPPGLGAPFVRPPARWPAARPGRICGFAVRRLGRMKQNAGRTKANTRAARSPARQPPVTSILRTIGRGRAGPNCVVGQWRGRESEHQINHGPLLAALACRRRLLLVWRALMSARGRRPSERLHLNETTCTLSLLFERRLGVVQRFRIKEAARYLAHLSRASCLQARQWRERERERERREKLTRHCALQMDLVAIL